MKGKQNQRRRGIALVPAMLIVSGLAIFTMALTTATLSGSRTLVHQADDYRLSSSVESVALLAMEELWSGFLQYAEANGRPQTIQSFREYMNILGIVDQADEFDPDGDGVIELTPGPDDGTSLLASVGLPQRNGVAQLNHVNVDALQAVRIDVSPLAGPSQGFSTQLFVTASVSSTRGQGLVNPIRNRAVQQVWTVEPEDFAGFDFAILANNVNCIFCHTNVDSAQRWFNEDPALYNSFDKIRVGTLESLLIRHDLDNNPSVTDGDADSFVAGTIYTRGDVLLHDGSAVPDWSDLSLQAYEFDPANGKLLEDGWGDLDSLAALSPAGVPPQAGENLYLDYPLDPAEQVDGPMPGHFPPPIPDDGGVDPATGLPDPNAIGNRRVDDAEFHEIAAEAKGAIVAGVIYETSPGEVIDTPSEYYEAVFQGNKPSVGGGRVDGNLVLTGTPQDPITIDGTVAVDGDLIIQGFVKGEGTLIVRGNVYMPVDVMYLDGSVDGVRTFGVAADGTRNALALAAGGNVLMGDFQRPASLKPDESYQPPGKYEIVSGNPDTGDPMQDLWSFSLAEMALFNRGEWEKTVPLLPGPGELQLPDPDPSTTWNEDWTVPSPNYDPNYVPRYYGYDEGTIIPIYNKGNLYYDGATGVWIGEEMVVAWDPDKLSYADPQDPTDPFLFDATGNAKAVASEIAHTGGWMDPGIYQLATEWFHDQRPQGRPLLIDGLVYTNNAIFTIINRDTSMRGRMIVNGSLVAADIGMLVPGLPAATAQYPIQSPLSGFSIGLQLNYDERANAMLNVVNPNRVTLKRTLWNPTANLL